MGCISLPWKRTQSKDKNTFPKLSKQSDIVATIHTATSSSSLTLQASNMHESLKENEVFSLPLQQEQLLLHAPKQPFDLARDAPLPELKTSNEALVQIQTISLNPVDWKGPAFNFGLPSLPCVLGRDLAGTIVKAPTEKSRLKVGDTVCAVSTDYRDYRKAAFQQYAIASDFNAFRVPDNISREEASASGVAFVTAAITLGICLGLKLAENQDPSDAPDLLTLTRSLDRSSLPEDIRAECFDSLNETERIRPGDWLVIWGASSTIGFFVLQLAKLAGVRVVCIADAIKHGQLLVENGADVIVHRKDPEEAIRIARSVTANRARFGVDAVGKKTAGLLQTILTPEGDSDDSTLDRPYGHLVGLTGGPQEPSPTVRHHQVPIKLFHESKVIGEAVVTWLERLLVSNRLQLPRVEISNNTGLNGINPALERLRSGSFTGHRIVVNV